MKITPIIKQILQYDPNVKKKEYRDLLHPSTSARIASYLDTGNDDGLSASLSSDEDKEDEMWHSIISVVVDHYSYNEKEQFMIVKTIEEMHDN